MAEEFLRCSEFLRHCSEILVSDEEEVDLVQDEGVGGGLPPPELTLEPLPEIYDSLADVLWDAPVLPGPNSTLSTPSTSPLLCVLHDYQCTDQAIRPEQFNHNSHMNIPESGVSNLRTISPTALSRFFVQQNPGRNSNASSCREEIVQSHEPAPARNGAKTFPAAVHPCVGRSALVDNVLTTQSYAQSAVPHTSFRYTALPQPAKPFPQRPVQLCSPRQYHQTSGLFGQPQILMPTVKPADSINNSGYVSRTSPNLIFAPLPTREEILSGRSIPLERGIDGSSHSSSTLSAYNRQDRRHGIVPYDSPESLHKTRMLRRSRSAPSDSQSSVAVSPRAGPATPLSAIRPRTLPLDLNNNDGCFIDLNSLLSNSPSEKNTVPADPSAPNDFRRTEDERFGIASIGENYIRQKVIEKEKEKVKRMEYSSKSRNRVQNAMYSLKSMVPGLGRRASQSTVLDYTISYIRYLRKYARSDLDEEFALEMTKIERQNWNPEITRLFEDTS